MFLSWFGYAHHDPEPGRMGRGPVPDSPGFPPVRSLTVPREIEGLKHAGMTDFGMVTMVTQQATGNRPEEIEKQILF